MASYVAYDTSIQNKVVDIFKKHIQTYFASTLGLETDIINILKALVLLESSYNPDALFIKAAYTVSPNQAGYDYLNSSAAISILQTGNTTQKAYLAQGIDAIGPMQVLGLNIIKGGSLKTGKCEVERLRPDLISTLVVNPGETPYNILLGISNLDKSLLAGLVMLEGKYKAVVQFPDGFGFNSDKNKLRFKTKISAAVGAYLGTIGADKNGVTAEKYAATITNGSYYIAANKGTGIPIGSSKISVASNAGPSTNGSNQSKISSAGCG